MSQADFSLRRLSQLKGVCDMADQKNRGGQKQGQQNPGQNEQKQGTTTQGSGERSNQDKRQDQMNNPDDAARQPTNK
jgi:hypothetical protein